MNSAESVSVPSPDIVEDKDGANQGRTGSGHGVLPGMRGDIVMGDDPDRYRSNTDRTEFQASRARMFAWMWVSSAAVPSHAKLEPPSCLQSLPPRPAPQDNRERDQRGRTSKPHEYQSALGEQMHRTNGPSDQPVHIRGVA